jgi:hypothetical protein
LHEKQQKGFSMVPLQQTQKKPFKTALNELNNMQEQPFFPCKLLSKHLKNETTIPHNLF